MPRRDSPGKMSSGSLHPSPLWMQTWTLVVLQLPFLPHDSWKLFQDPVSIAATPSPLSWHYAHHVKEQKLKTQGYSELNCWNWCSWTANRWSAKPWEQNVRGGWGTFNSTGQLRFGGVSSKVLGFPSSGGVALFYPALQVRTDFTSNPAKCFLQECKVTMAVRWAKDFFSRLYQTAIPIIH